MADCALCDFGGELLFEESGIVAALPMNPLVPGHAVVFPRQHFKILEQVPDDVMSALFGVANKVSSAMFEALSAQGTNIIVMSGHGAGQRVPHVAADVIPRSKDDGLSFVWPAKKLSDEQMGIVEQEIRAQALSVGAAMQDEPMESSETPAGKSRDEAKERSGSDPGKRHGEDARGPAHGDEDDDESLFRKQLRRLP